MEQIWRKYPDTDLIHTSESAKQKIREAYPEMSTGQMFIS